ncbi:MAG: ribonuclease domain-containing protein, partial [Pyrinomonadaceae bacterium]
NSGDLAKVKSRKTPTDIFRPYAGSFKYNAAGTVSSMRLGNGKFENTQFNSRLQPTQIGLGSSVNTQNLLKLNYGYGATNNNGNVLSQTITVPTAGSSQGFTAVQNYTYDSLNRLQSATENIDGSPTPSWKQTFTFDCHGNRRFDTANTTTLAPGCAEAVCNPQIDPATNRLIGYQSDNAGNTKTDANGQTFIYDSENKQVQVNGSAGTIGQYFYDGDGKRIKKVVLSTVETTVFVYDAAGKLVAEYSTIVASPSEAKVAYLTNDPLGSPRTTTDQFGQIISRRDFMPFGEEIARAGYGTDSIRQKFTGYERDNESSFNFAQARYYYPMHGRFTSVDPENAGAMEDDPQSWNGYAYGRNNPVLFTDPDGREYLLCDKDRKTCVTQTDEIVKGAQRRLRDSFQQTEKQGHFDSGNVLDGDGNTIGTYERISIDREYQFIYNVAEHSAKKAKTVGALVGGAVLGGVVIGVCTATGGVPCAAAATAVVTAANKLGVPQRVRDALRRIKQSNGRSPSGYKGGRTFQNREGNLPTRDSRGNPVTYKEYDVNPHTPGVNRGGERIMRGSDGSSYYTNDHYKTFKKIE